MSHPDESTAAQRAARDHLHVVGEGEPPSTTDTPQVDDVRAAASTPARPRRTPRIGPQAARTAHRARRTWFALLFFPFFAVYRVIDALRDVRDGMARVSASSPIRSMRLRSASTRLSFMRFSS